MTSTETIRRSTLETISRAANLRLEIIISYTPAGLLASLGQPNYGDDFAAGVLDDLAAWLDDLYKEGPAGGSSAVSYLARCVIQRHLDALTEAAFFDACQEAFEQMDEVD